MIGLMRGQLSVSKRGWGAGVPWPLGHCRVTPVTIEFWGSFGLVAKRSIQREEVTRVLGVQGRQKFAIFELEDGSLSPVMFRLTRSFRAALAKHG